MTKIINIVTDAGVDENTSSTLTVLSRVTDLLLVSTHISKAYVLHVHNILAENIVCVVNTT